MQKITVFWFRRDLRLEDNVGLCKALQTSNAVLPIFIFDSEILDNLPKNDARVTFIHQALQKIDDELKKHQSSILVKKGNPLSIFKELTELYTINAVFTNSDYEPYTINRDKQVAEYLQSKNIEFYSCKDQVAFEKNEVVKDDGNPYTIFTPYKNKWLKRFDSVSDIKEYSINFGNFYIFYSAFPSLAYIGFEKSTITVKSPNFSFLTTYDATRDYPNQDTTSYLSPHLRFGTVSIRKMIKIALKTNQTFLSELIWREFFMQILWHFPKVVTHNFKAKYDAILWRNNEAEFTAWCKGETGYPMVDAGMRQLNTTGYMHNRVRMITAGFLCKHLLIDWRWGEAYFAEKLLDYDLSANNGNWQWVAGTGCDAVPYFRVFNPESQLTKFDKNLRYIRKWVENFDELTYPPPIVPHKMARERAIATYKKALQ